MRKIPRGKGYDKASILKHDRALVDQFPMSVNTYARKNKLNADFLWRSFGKYLPDYEFIVNLKKCEYCERDFAYSVKTQRFCSTKCAADKKRDLEYFSGNRRSTKGLAEGVCQVCYAEPTKGLASHHVYGKAADPKGKTLVALCKGCHDLVGKLGTRNFINDPKILENLIALAHLRKHGPDKKLKVKVEIESTGKRTISNS